VIFPIEDPADYPVFEHAVTADYLAETAVERELVLRLASLLRRATWIETARLRIQLKSRKILALLRHHLKTAPCPCSGWAS
jgi:hypothetical protein